MQNMKDMIMLLCRQVIVYNPKDNILLQAKGVI